MAAEDLAVSKAGFTLLWCQPKCCSRCPWRCGRGGLAGGDLCSDKRWLTWAPLLSGSSSGSSCPIPSSSHPSAGALPGCGLWCTNTAFPPTVVVPALGEKISVCSCWWEGAAVYILCLSLFLPRLEYNFPSFAFHAHENHFLFTHSEQNRDNNLALPEICAPQVCVSWNVSFGYHDFKWWPNNGTFHFIL